MEMYVYFLGTIGPTKARFLLGGAGSLVNSLFGLCFRFLKIYMFSELVMV